jgi:hypothetical protein
VDFELELIFKMTDGKGTEMKPHTSFTRVLENRKDEQEKKKA